MMRLVPGLVLIALPLAEIFVLVKTGQLIGFWATLALVVGAGMVGGLILSRQSLNVLRQTMVAASEGRPPVEPVLDGVFLLMAGGLLVMPGLISDAMALLLLVPPIRRAVAHWTMRELIQRADVHVSVRRTGAPGGPSHPAQAAGDVEGPVIEGEFERLGDKTAEPGRGSDAGRP